MELRAIHRPDHLYYKRPMNQKKFWKAIEEARAKPFEWGAHDCVTFALNCVVASTGNDSYRSRVAEVFGEWTNAREAARIYGDDLVAPISRILGEPVSWVRLTQGDVAVFVDDEGRQVVAVHDGVSLITPNAIGVRSVSADRALCGWKVK